MTNSTYFDAHLHLAAADDTGFDALLKMLENTPACIGGNLILNTAAEAAVVLQRREEIPEWLQVIPCLDLIDLFQGTLGCGWVKLHPSIQRIKAGDIPAVVARTTAHRAYLKGVVVHCFPWGCDRDYNCSLDLVNALAQALPDRWVLATHGGGYESWAYRAHIGGFKNVLFDFSATLAYYAGSDLLRPLQRYLAHSPERVLFGTDWPSAAHQEQWEEMLLWSSEVGIDPKRLESLLLENSRRTWPGWKPRT